MGKLWRRICCCCACCCPPEDDESLGPAQEPLLGRRPPSKAAKRVLFTPAYPAATDPGNLPDEVHVASIDPAMPSATPASEVIVKVDRILAEHPPSQQTSNHTVEHENTSTSIDNTPPAMDTAGIAETTQPAAPARTPGAGTAVSELATPFAAATTPIAPSPTADQDLLGTSTLSGRASTELQPGSSGQSHLTAHPITMHSLGSDDAAGLYFSPTSSLKVAASDASSVYFDAPPAPDDLTLPASGEAPASPQPPAAAIADIPTARAASEPTTGLSSSVGLAPPSGSDNSNGDVAHKSTGMAASESTQAVPSASSGTDADMTVVSKSASSGASGAAGSASSEAAPEQPAFGKAAGGGRGRGGGKKKKGRR